MKKKVISSIISAAMLTAPAAFAAEPGDKVEISFKVGDSTLTVNGEQLTLNAPYVVGDGTTLVPIRVITEAFGAQVDWDGATQSVSLKYPDVDIMIRIGSKSATVNTHTEELAVAPELNNDTTMVPLRFISETFGAQVNYDDATRLITVTKAASSEVTEGTTVQGATDKDYIGDSFYGWTMQNPKKLPMYEKSFDCKKIVFSDKENGAISVNIRTADEAFDADTEFNDIKNVLSGDTIQIADKKTLSDGTTQIHFRSKNKEWLSDINLYINGKKEYGIFTSIPTESQMKDELLSISESFALTTTGRDYYNLSNVNGKVREYSNDELKLKLSIPAEWTQSEGSADNYMHFYNTDKSKNYISIGVYSKDASTNAKALADNDRQSWVSVANPELATISDVTSTTINGIGGYKYTAEYNGHGDNKYVMSDNFFDLGDYVYNIAICEDSFTASSNIISTLKLEKLDKDEVGIMLRDSDLSGTHKLENMFGTLTLPSSWEALGAGSNATVLNAVIDQRTGGIIMINKTSDTSSKQIGEYFPELIRQMSLQDGYTSLGANKTKSVSSNLFYYNTLVREKEDEKCYTTVYMMKKGGYVYTFIYDRPDIFYGSVSDKEAEEIVFGFEPAK